MANEARTNERSHWAAAIIGLYLVFHQVVLCYLAFAAWVADRKSLSWILKCLLGLAYSGELTDAKFALFQNVVIAACAAGLGGAVYMVRELYIKYAYGRFEDEIDKDGHKVKVKKEIVQVRRYLEISEIPRYILLPFSSVIMGPILLGLMRSGAIALTGSPSGSATDVPRFTILVVCFVLGYSYHDTLGFFSDLSKRILAKASGGNKNERTETKRPGG
jgi:hypothetical protein